MRRNGRYYEDIDERRSPYEGYYPERRDFEDNDDERRSAREARWRNRNMYGPNYEGARRFGVERREWDDWQAMREGRGREYEKGGLLGRRGYRYPEMRTTPRTFERAETWAPEGGDTNYGAMDRWDQFRTIGASERRNGLNEMRPVHYGKGPRGYERSDERIKEDVNEILFENPYIDASNIDVQVDKGVVTLSGSVENGALRRLSEECIECIPGVKDVDNRLRATPEAFSR